MSRRPPEIRFSRIVDLSLEISPKTQMFPTYPQPAFTPWTTREVHGFFAESLFLASHTGTHVDAPWHFERNGKKLDGLPIDRFVVPGHVLALGALRPLQRIARSDLLRSRRALGRPIRAGDAVLLRTGWERVRGRPDYLFKNPGLSKGAALELVEWRVGLVGIDTANIDHPADGAYPAHHALLAADIPVIENVANLKGLGNRRFTLLALPLALAGASGSPIRLAALVE